MFRPLLLTTAIAAIVFASTTCTSSASDPVRIIFETDMQTDCDDAGALAVLHALADWDEAEIDKLVVMSMICGYDGCNVKQDVEGAHDVVQGWPTPILFSDLGRHVITGPRLPLECDEDHIIRRAYEIHTDNRWNKGYLNRSSWDQAAVLYAVRGEGTYFKEVPFGSVSISPRDWYVDWQPTPDRQQGFIKQSVSDSQLAAVISKMMVRPGKADRQDNDWGSITMREVEACGNCFMCDDDHHKDKRPLQDTMLEITLENSRIRAQYAPNLHDGGMVSYFWKDKGVELAGGDYLRLDYGDCRYQPTKAWMVEDGPEQKTVHIEWGYNWEIGVGRIIPVKNTDTWKLLYEASPAGFEYRVKGSFESYIFPSADGDQGLISKGKELIDAM